MSENWPLLAAIFYIATSCLLWVGKIGKERKPVTPAQGALGLVEYGALAGLMIWAVHFHA